MELILNKKRVCVFLICLWFKKKTSPQILDHTVYSFNLPFHMSSCFKWSFLRSFTTELLVLFLYTPYVFINVTFLITSRKAQITTVLWCNYHNISDWTSDMLHIHNVVTYYRLLCGLQTVAPVMMRLHCYKTLNIYIYIYVFINCNWVAPGGSTHLNTNNT
jgi:hypothetical protein